MQLNKEFSPTLKLDIKTPESFLLKVLNSTYLITFVTEVISLPPRHLNTETKKKVLILLVNL